MRRRWTRQVTSRKDTRVAMQSSSPVREVVRRGLHQLYTRFAFAYDGVSFFVSRGEWRSWTRAAIPFVRGTRVLEIAFGTGDLHLDLYDAGYMPIGIDLSPNMGAITRNKFRAQHRAAPRLVRTRVQQLPFPTASFSSLVMTFPPGFVYDLEAMRELWRVLEPQGVLLWVDAPHIYPRDVWSRFLHWFFVFTGESAEPETEHFTTLLREAHEGALAQMWSWRVEPVESKYSRIHVFIGIKDASHSE